MAVVDDLGYPGMDASPPSEDFGRQPPQDLAAEQSVLGGMLLSKDAIADVLERLRPGDFYRPVHQNVYDAILDLYGRGSRPTRSRWPPNWTAAGCCAASAVPRICTP